MADDQEKPRRMLQPLLVNVRQLQLPPPQRAGTRVQEPRELGLRSCDQLQQHNQPDYFSDSKVRIWWSLPDFIFNLYYDKTSKK